MWQIFAFFRKNSFGQFAALHFSSSDENSPLKKTLCEIGGASYFPIVRQTISCLRRGNSKIS
jgi:hypothetical protein